MATAKAPRGFRPWKATQDRLTFAEEIGLNVSELINEVLDKHLENEIKDKARKIRERLKVPVQ